MVEIKARIFDIMAEEDRTKQRLAELQAEKIKLVYELQRLQNEPKKKTK